MKQCNVAFAIFVSLFLGFCGAGMFAILVPIFGPRLTFNFVWLSVGLVYLWMFPKVPPTWAPLRVFDSVVILGLFPIALVCSPSWFVLSFAISFWLMRVRRCQQNAGLFCVDLIVTLGAAGLAIANWQGNHDFFSTLWVFMLVSCMLFFIPEGRQVENGACQPDFDAVFAQASRQAEQALQKLVQM